MEVQQVLGPGQGDSYEVDSSGAESGAGAAHFT